MLRRLNVALLMATIFVVLNSLSDYFGDLDYQVQTWIGVFLLPVWSIVFVGFWHDLGRLIWTRAFGLDSKNSNVSTDVRSLVFVLWMAIAFTFLVWVHVSLCVTPLLLVIPLLGIPFRNYLTHDWALTPKITYDQLISLVFWGALSYTIYWLLNIGWILIRVYLIEYMGEGLVYIIQ